MRHQLICITLLALGLSLFILNICTEWVYLSHGLHGRTQREPYSVLGPLFKAPNRALPSTYLVDTPGCRIPAMDPFDPLVKKFIKKVKPIDCAGNSSPRLVKSNLTSLYVDHSTFAYYNISDADQLQCCYRPFWRVEGDLLNYTIDVDDEIGYDTDCTSFQNEVRVNMEFVTVECIMNDSMYRDFYAFTPLTRTIKPRRRAMKSSKREGDSLSVLVIGIDAVSRLNFHRQMPLTEEFLREMGAIEMLGYNKVADNTFPNLVPVLSGLTEEELTNTCWNNSEVSFDLCPWLWKNYSAAGYTTAFGEDAPWMGIFSYLKAGFVQQPTDYYLRPYMKEYEDYVGHVDTESAKICIGPRLTVEVLLEYVTKFALTMKKNPYFSLFWGGSLSHDYLNFPQLGDSLHESVLRKLVASGALNRTLLIVTSDHGIRWGPIRKTYQGRLEERLPLLSFVFPAWFREKYSGAITNLRRNAQRLTTPFDLHATLLDFLKLSSLNKESLQNRKETQVLKPVPRGLSLFLPVSENRTCTDAGILTHWCTCTGSSRSVSPTSETVNKLVRVLVNHLNGLLRPYPSCARLKLKRVYNAKVYTQSIQPSSSNEDGVQKTFILVMRTKPGNALFEATILNTINNKMKISGTVSRVNPYGLQSSCIDDFHMRLYCYCKNWKMSERVHGANTNVHNISKEE